MLTADLVRVRRRAGTIQAQELRPAERQRLLLVAQAFIDILVDRSGHSRGTIEAAWDKVEITATDYKLVRGLRKLLLDRCQFAAADQVDPAEVRRTVFTEAARVRSALAEEESFDRAAVLQTAAGTLQLSPEATEQALYADLKENHLLLEFAEVGAEHLLDSYEMSQQQAILLRAVKVVIELRCADAGGYRLFFQRLKFRRLLYTLEQLPEGHFRITVDGPHSLFQAVTKYGLQLALLLPALQQSGTWSLSADILWGKQRQALTFFLDGGDESPEVPHSQEITLPEDIERLVASFQKKKTDWQVGVAHQLLDLPGVGLCVPDLVFTHGQTKTEVFLEVMGYWSRQAVWRRVEMVQAGLPYRVIFAVSNKLRVSEKVLDQEQPGQLYVYKGVMRANAILEKLELLLPEPDKDRKKKGRKKKGNKEKDNKEKDKKDKSQQKKDKQKKSRKKK